MEEEVGGGFLAGFFTWVNSMSYPATTMGPLLEILPNLELSRLK